MFSGKREGVFSFRLREIKNVTRTCIPQAGDIYNNV